MKHRPGLVALWFPIIGSLAAWAIHLVAEASLVRSSQRHHDVVWVMHGLTVATGLVAIVAIAVASRVTTAATDGEDAGTVEGRTAFMGWLGLYVAAFNLGLIVLEGLYIAGIDRHA